jgi:hypothetical protein
MQPQSPLPPAPALAPGQVIIAGAPLQGAQAIYEGYRAQVRELDSQLNELGGTRRDITSQLSQLPPGSPERTGLEGRMSAIDGRISAVDKQLADANALLAKAAAVPGAVHEERIVREGPPEEVWVLSGMFLIIVLLPLSIAYARRIWRRGAVVVSALPKEISERLGRVEQAVDATAVEVERIGEGQRFLTRLFTEGDGIRSLGAPKPALVEKKAADGGPGGR